MAKQPRISLEIYPPPANQGDAALDAALGRMMALRPDFMSVTYGADGSGQDRSLRLVQRLAVGDGMPLAAHLTCVGARREMVDAVARGWWQLGIRRIVALRGDMPGGGAWQPRADGYANAAGLVAGLKRVAPFDIAVAAYPEGHPDSPNPAADIDNLKAKQDAGAALAITQYCFDDAAFARLRDRAVAAGVSIPIVPGVLPVHDFARVVSFSRRCGATIPDWLAGRFAGLEDNAPARAEVAAEIAADQIVTLAREGFDRFHLYTLNRADLAEGICRRIGIRPGVARAA